MLFVCCLEKLQLFVLHEHGRNTIQRVSIDDEMTRV